MTTKEILHKQNLQEKIPPKLIPILPKSLNNSVILTTNNTSFQMRQPPSQIINNPNSHPFSPKLSSKRYKCFTNPYLNPTSLKNKSSSLTISSNKYNTNVSSISMTSAAPLSSMPKLICMTPSSPKHLYLPCPNYPISHNNKINLKIKFVTF